MQILILQPVIDRSLRQVSDDGDDRYPEEHAKRSPDVAAYRDGEDNPQRFQAGGIAQDLWT